VTFFQQTLNKINLFQQNKTGGTSHIAILLMFPKSRIEQKNKTQIIKSGFTLREEKWLKDLYSI